MNASSAGSQTFEHAPFSRLAVVLCISGFVGFVIGAFLFPSWQHAVEGAQVRAGLVNYPPNNPFYYYQVKVWTLWHQIPAIFLQLGIQEHNLSIIVSGLLGMLSFQALAVTVFCFTNDMLVVLAAPIFIFFTHAANFGKIYPILLLGTNCTYGVVGLGLSYLILAISSAGYYRLSFFLLGLAPANHLTLGLMTWIITGINVLWDWKNFKPHAKRALKYFLAGLIVTLISFLIHRIFTFEKAATNPQIALEYFHAFIQNWDSHRQPVPFNSPDICLNLALIFLAITGLKRRDLPHSSRWLLQTTVAAGTLGMTVALISWIPLQHLPMLWLKVMPARILTFNLFGFAAFLMGYLRAYPKSIAAQVVLALMMLGLILIYWNQDYIFVVLFLSATLFTVLMWMGITAYRTSQKWVYLLCRGVVLLLFLVMGIQLSSHAIYHVKETLYQFSIPMRNQAILKARSGHGVLLSSSNLVMNQILTRRPVLLDPGALDIVSYSPEIGPLMQAALSKVYGFDFLKRPPGVGRIAVIPPGWEHKKWQERSLEQWQAIRREFGITEVLATRHYDLKLPLLIEDQELRLYSIPED